MSTMTTRAEQQRAGRLARAVGGYEKLVERARETLPPRDHRVDFDAVRSHRFLMHKDENYRAAVLDYTLDQNRVLLASAIAYQEDPALTTLLERGWDPEDPPEPRDPIADLRIMDPKIVAEQFMNCLKPRTAGGWRVLYDDVSRTADAFWACRALTDGVPYYGNPESMLRQEQRRKESAEAGNLCAEVRLPWKPTPWVRAR